MYKNPFKAGDKVKLLKSSYDFNPILWRKYDGYTYSIVTEVFDGQISTTEDSSPQHYRHFELYKEPEEEVMNSQPKTKRVLFSVAAWTKYKDVAKVYLNGKLCGAFLPMLNYQNDQGYALYKLSFFGDVEYYSVWGFELEIPVTTKRIPFNPELKDAKVFTTDSNQSVVDWAMFKDGQVACQWPNQYMGYYPTNLLEMEIEEDV